MPTSRDRVGQDGADGSRYTSGAAGNVVKHPSAPIFVVPRELDLEPAGDVCRNESTREALPRSLGRTLQDAWNSVLLICPSPLDMDRVNALRMSSAMPTIDAELLTFITLMDSS